MPRPFWKGAINFGLVVIPVKMYIATQSVKPSFHLLHKKDNSRIRQVLYCPEDDKYLEREDIVRGYEYARGKFIVLKDSDLEKVPLKTTRTIDVLGFASLEEIDPVYYFDAHYLEPEETGARPYSLLHRTLAGTGRVGIAKVSFQRREHLCCLRPEDKVLVLHTLHYKNEVRSTEDLIIPPQELKAEELKMAGTLIDEMIIKFKPEGYKDDYVQALKKLINAKLEGKEIPVPEVTPKETPDLVAALQKSIEFRKKEKVGAQKKG